MKNVILKKENGVVSKLENKEYIIDELSQKHLCSKHCNLETFKKCKKVFGNKKLIDSYDFITDGYQVFNAQGELKIFCVNKCKNCKEDYEAKPTAKEELTARQKRNELMKAYFGDN